MVQGVAQETDLLLLALALPFTLSLRPSLIDVEEEGVTTWALAATEDPGGVRTAVEGEQGFRARYLTRQRQLHKCWDHKL